MLVIMLTLLSHRKSLAKINMINMAPPSVVWRLVMWVEVACVNPKIWIVILITFNTVNYYWR